jgi:prepilin-type N-terminal cleavage/methylation domain-containing protein
MKKGGFTLIEMLTVVCIIAVLVTIASPELQKAIEKSRQGEAIATLNLIYTGYKVYKIDYGPMPAASWEDLGFDSAPQGKYFDYSYDGTNGIGLAERKGDSSKWIQIDLDVGNITKSAPY